MENKYYTPELKEFHVGFEFEYETVKNSNNWKPKRVSITNHMGNLESNIENSLFRVKYLDQSDIESLGFSKVDEPQALGFEECYEKLGVVIRMSPRSLNLGIRLKIGYRNTLRDGSGKYKGFIDNFKGEIKNKSELVKILEMIGYEK